MVVENGYSTSVNNTSNENNSSIMDNLQRYVKGLEFQLAESERMVKAKDQEIARLQNENKNLRAATTPHFFHQNQPRFQSFDRFDLRQKVPELKREITRAVDKALENFLGEQMPNPQSPNRPQGWDATPPPIQARSPLTTQPTTPDRSIDDSSTNISSSTNLLPSDMIVNQSSYKQVQDLGSNSSIEDSKEESREPPSYNNINNDNELKQNSQNSSTSSLNGVTNRRYNGNNINNNNNNNNGSNNNNNNNNMNKRRAYTPYTAFVSWQGPIAPPLKNFFPPEDVKDIRQSPNKSFAHIDFNSNDALERALGKNNTPLNQHGIQGNLRVEKGKPRSNTTGNENVQRPQYQNQNQNKYPQKKNGFNSTSSHNNHHFGMGVNGYSNHNGHTNDSYPSQEDKTQPWQQFSRNNGELSIQPSNTQDHNKNTED